MKKTLLLIVAIIFSIISVIAQPESVKPTYGVDIEREVTFASINNKDFQNVTVLLKAASISSEFANGVKVVIRDTESGKRLYKKRFSKSYLYAFSDGTIQVGKGNALTQISLYKSNGYWRMILKEKGIY